MTTLNLGGKKIKIKKSLKLSNLKLDCEVDLSAQAYKVRDEALPISSISQTSLI